MGDPLRINSERGLHGIGAIDLLGDLMETRLELRDEGRGGGGELDGLTVGRRRGTQADQGRSCWR